MAGVTCALAYSALGLPPALLHAASLFLTCQFPSSILPNELVSEAGQAGGWAVDRTRTAEAADRLSSPPYLADAVSVNGQ